MIGTFIRVIQIVFPGAFKKHVMVLKKEREYEFQLATLERLLTYALLEPVTCGYASDGKENSVVIVRTESEILARLTIHPKGVLRRSTYVKVHTDMVVLTGWFQLAFLWMKVTVVPFTETLLLTYQKPREQ